MQHRLVTGSEPPHCVVQYSHIASSKGVQDLMVAGSIHLEDHSHGRRWSTVPLPAGSHPKVVLYRLPRVCRTRPECGEPLPSPSVSPPARAWSTASLPARSNLDTTPLP